MYRISRGGGLKTLKENIVILKYAHKMLRFFLSSNSSLPYKIKSMNLLSFSAEKELSISFKQFIRADLFPLESHYRSVHIILHFTVYINDH